MNAQIAEILEGRFGVEVPEYVVEALGHLDPEEAQYHVQMRLSDAGLNKLKSWYADNSLECTDVWNWEAVRMELEDQWLNSGEYGYAEVFSGPGRRNPEVLEFSGDELEFAII